MRIGVTGNYASGKGTVCRFFASYGAVIIDTDIISRDLSAPGQPIFDEITSVFGKEFLNADSSLDRRKLARYVFSDKNRTERLNAIMHPAILEKTLESSKNADTIYMINAPLLFESGFDKYMESIILVLSTDTLSISRGIARDGLTEKEILERLSHQKTINEKINKADYIIDNSIDIENTKKQVKEIWNKIINKT